MKTKTHLSNIQAQRALKSDNGSYGSLLSLLGETDEGSVKLYLELLEWLLNRTETDEMKHEEECRKQVEPDWLQLEECGLFPYHYCHLSRGSPVIEAVSGAVRVFLRCEWVYLCVFACSGALSRSYAKGKKQLLHTYWSQLQHKQAGNKLQNTLQLQGSHSSLLAYWHLQYWPSWGRRHFCRWHVSHHGN